MIPKVEVQLTTFWGSLSHINYLRPSKQLGNPNNVLWAGFSSERQQDLYVSSEVCSRTPALPPPASAAQQTPLQKPHGEPPFKPPGKLPAPADAPRLPGVPLL